MSSENINSSISSKSEEDYCSNNEETESYIQHGTWRGPRFPFIGKLVLHVKIHISKNLLEFFELFITLEISELTSQGHQLL